LRGSSGRTGITQGSIDGGMDSTMREISMRRWSSRGMGREKDNMGEWKRGGGRRGDW